jgi:hypothetical protein
MTFEMTIQPSTTTSACPRCDRPAPESQDAGGAAACLDCGYEAVARFRPAKAVATWAIRRRKPLLATAAGVGTAALATAWPEQFSRWVLVLFAIVVAILVLAGVLRLPNGSYQLAAVLIVPALIMPLLWRYVSIGCFSAFVAVGMLTDSVKSRLKRSTSVETAPAAADMRLR